nr:transposase [Actinomadura formosensis]
MITGTVVDSGGYPVAGLLLGTYGVGPDTAAALLIAAGDNPERPGTRASFAALCGVSPIEASSGRTQRHRLNRGGDRQANCALHTIVLSRLRRDQRTRDYVQRRTAEGKTRREAIRCLKRYVAREIHQLITRSPSATAPMAA